MFVYKNKLIYSTKLIHTHVKVLFFFFYNIVKYNKSVVKKFPTTKNELVNRETLYLPRDKLIKQIVSISNRLWYFQF